MSDGQKKIPDEKAPESKTLWTRFTGLFDKNYFLLIISLITAVIIWFIFMVSQLTEESPRVIYDVPITIHLSEQAQKDGLKVYKQSYNTADISVTGSSLVTNRLTAEDFEVMATFSPSSTKLSGTALQTETLTLKATKKNAVGEYDISSFDPSEITIEYDRSKEITLPIDAEIKYTPESSYHADAPSLSDNSVTISGPESSVNKISRVSAVYEFTDPLREETTITCELTLYGQDDKPIGDYAGLYLDLSTTTVEVTIPVNSKKTVQLKPILLNAPKGFAESRITLEPATIDIVGSEAELAKIEEIALGPPINFNEIDLNNTAYERDIPIPSGVKSLSGDEGMKAKVEINLNGYVPEKRTTSNITTVNKPAGKTVKVMTTSITVNVMGSEAQMAKLTGESISVTVDLTNKADSTGSFDMPAIVTFDGADSCWAYGTYMVSVTITDGPSAQANTGIESKASQNDAAKPND